MTPASQTELLHGANGATAAGKPARTVRKTRIDKGRRRKPDPTEREAWREYFRNLSVAEQAFELGYLTALANAEDLRKRAVKWLTNTRGCSVVLSEMVSAAWEIPDAIGWKSAQSILIECKISRADFLANTNKPTVRAERGMGRQRYFLVPAGLVTKGDMDRYPGYGLLALHDSGAVRVVVEALRRESAQEAEIAMLVSALRRVRTKEFLTVVVESEPQCPIPS